jgi:hypothetical protein
MEQRFLVTLHVSPLEIAAVVIGAITLFLFAWILWYTRKTAVEAKRANDRADDEVSKRLRPWIGIGSPSVMSVISGLGVNLANRTPIEPLRIPEAMRNDDDGVIVLGIRIINYGAMPASSVWTSIEYSPDRSEAIAGLSGAQPGNAVINPNQDNEQSLEIAWPDYRAARFGDNPFWVAVKVVYAGIDELFYSVEALFRWESYHIIVEMQTTPQKF